MIRIAAILIALTSPALAVVWLPVIDNSGNDCYLSGDVNEPATQVEATWQVDMLNTLAGQSGLYFLPTLAQLQAGVIEDNLPIYQDQGWDGSWDASGTALWRVGLRAVDRPRPDLGILANNYDLHDEPVGTVPEPRLLAAVLCGWMIHARRT